MTDLKFTTGSTFNPSIVYWQDEAKTIPHDLTGFTCEFFIKDDAEDNDAVALYNLSNAGAGLILTPLDGKMDITLTDEQSSTLTKSFYYWELKINSSAGERTTIGVGRLVKS